MSDSDDKSSSFHYSDDELPPTLEIIANALIHNKINVINRIKRSPCTCDISDIPSITLYQLNTLFVSEAKRDILILYGYDIDCDNIHRVNHLWNIFLRSTIARLQCSKLH
jgi:hypothetical protein